MYNQSLRMSDELNHITITGWSASTVILLTFLVVDCCKDMYITIKIISYFYKN